jgi:hypothetical protein
MRKIIVCLALAFMAIPSFAQTNSDEYDKVVRYFKDKGWTQTADNRVAKLKEGGYTTWWSRSFYAALEYAGGGFSDDKDVEDIDIEVRTLDNGLISKDDASDTWAIATFTLKSQETLKIKMTNHKSETPDYASSCRYLIFYR